MTSPKLPQPKRGWFFVMVKVFVVTVFLLVGLWSGVTLWIFFFLLKPPFTPPTSPSTLITEFLEEETETHDKNALLKGAEDEDLIEYPADIRRKILYCKSMESEIAERENLIELSKKLSSRIEKGFNLLRNRGVTQEEIESDPNYPELEAQWEFRETHTSYIDLLLLEIILLEDRYPPIKI